MDKRPIFDKLDERKGIVSAILMIVGIVSILYVLTYEIADPPPVDYKLTSNIEIADIVLKNLKMEGGGSGTPSDAKVDPRPTPKTEKQLTQKNSKTSTNSGKANVTNAPNSQNEATSPVKSNNPFGGNGPGKDEKGGRGNKGLGPDEGVKSGGGGEDRAPRIRLNDPNADDIVSDVNCIIRVKVSINANGDVVRADNISSITTTNDQRIINRVLELVKAQAKYNKKPNAPIEQAYITVTLRAS
jgi:hypothetical protein